MVVVVGGGPALQRASEREDQREAAALGLRGQDDAQTGRP